MRKSGLSGVVEKGPFVSGTSVAIYELTDDLRPTGKSFSTTTGKDGSFELTDAMDFASAYVKLVVSGFYFNEVTGKLSGSPVLLEAIADIKDRDKINANLLTHLEVKRVMHLVEEEEMSFKEAKKQAEKELLACFLIDNKTIVPEEASITANNTEADILIAVSSILLRSLEVDNQADASLTERIDAFRDDFASDGTIGDAMKETISHASYKLNYKEVKKNIVNRYEELGKEVSVGNFQYFIDGKGEGKLSEEDYPVDEKLEELEFFRSEEDFQAFLTSVVSQRILNAVQNHDLFDAMFTGTIDDNLLNSDVYLRRITPVNTQTGDLYMSLYRSITQGNILIEKGLDSKPEFARYAYAAIVYRAYQYMILTDLWGDVPFITKQPDVDASISRTSKETIHASLLKDLQEAEHNLDETGNSIICSKYLATALLAKLYLSMGDYSNALLYASKVINSGNYSLCTNYNNIFEPNNKETLFSIASGEQGQDVYEPVIKGTETPLVRYAEILLIAAEANLKLGNTTQAVEQLNQVRSRNQRSLLSASSSASSIETALLEEWKTDLEREGVWFSTLKRFGLAEKELGIPSYMLLLPIPQREIDTNPNMTQNEGYY